MKNKCRQHGTRAPCLFYALLKKFKKLKKGAKVPMNGNVKKSYAISDAKIKFVSLVDKAANKHEFLITKSEGGNAWFQTYGRIVKADEVTHYVTGIVYEPMVEDTDGNYMTEEEITKAAHWFMKNAGDADIQHCFEKAEGVEVVESYVAKCDMEIEGQPIKKGTWLMTMEVTNGDVWESIEKKDITGFSMGGQGKYSSVDVDITDPDNPVEKKCGGGAKTCNSKADDEKTKKGKGIAKQIASLFGLDVVEKGAVKEQYKQRIVRDNFWTAFYSLSDNLLDTYNPDTQRYETVHDETKIREALEDFNEIVTDLLTDKDGIYKSIEKAGKKMSTENRSTLQGIYENLGTFLAKFDEEEEIEVTKAEIESIVVGAVQKAMSGEAAQAANSGVNPAGEVQKGAGNQSEASGGNGASEAITAESIEKMVKAAIQKQMQPKEEPLTMESVQDLIEKSVAKAMEPVLKSAGVPTNMNNEIIQKSEEEEHYLHGFL